MQSVRSQEWQEFSEEVNRHIEEYTVPQYGDKGEDLCTDYTTEHCIKQIEKYVKRFGRNSRPGQTKLDMLKIAHYAQMCHRNAPEE